MRDHEDSIASLDDAVRTPGLGVSFRDVSRRHVPADVVLVWEGQARDEPEHIWALIEDKP